MKTRKRRSDGAAGPAARAATRVNLVGCDPLTNERVRASLAGSPFRLLATAVALPPTDVDLYIAPAAALDDVADRGVPIIARGSAALLRAALLAGCVDYLRDPWTAEECAARLQAAVSRAEPRWTLPWAGARLEGCRVVSRGAAVTLTWHEAALLRALLRFRGSPVPREALSRASGGEPHVEGSRAIDVHLSAVRRKLRPLVPPGARSIVAVRGQGYMVP